jgi:membrane protein
LFKLADEVIISIMKYVKEVFSLLRETYLSCGQANSVMLAAALSFYTLLSLAPLLFIAVSVAGIVFSERAVTEMLIKEVSTVVSPQTALALRTVLESRAFPHGSGWVTSIGVVATLAGASLVFVQLKNAINLLWGIAPHPKHGLFVRLRTHFLSFLMIFVVILMLLALMVVSTLLVSLNQFLQFLPAALVERLPEADFGITFIGFTALFAVIFKTLPDAKTAWQDVLIGAAATSLLFTLGGFLFGVYLGNVALFSAYGATASVILILVWVNLSMNIILFGAKLTQVLANRYGSQVVPSRRAARILQQLDIDRDTRPRL